MILPVGDDDNKDKDDDIIMMKMRPVMVQNEVPAAIVTNE